MTLGDYVEQYIREHDLAENTIESYRYSIQTFQRWFGRPIDIEQDLTTDLVNSFLQWMKREGRSSYTRKRARGTILVFWRAANRDRRLNFKESPEYVMRLRMDELDPECFTLEQTEQLVRHCRTLKGTVGSLTIPRSLYYTSFVRAAWDSGVRLGDLLDFDTRMVNLIVQSRGMVRVMQNKSRRFVDVLFHPSTIEAMQECLECVPRTAEVFGPFPPNMAKLGIEDMRHQLPTDRVWPAWTKSRKPWHREFKVVVEGAGLKGGTKFLRRGAATEAELHEPGSAARKLGHSPNSRGVAETHYICRKVLPMAPVIGRELSA